MRGGEAEMTPPNSAPPPCRTVEVFAFLGDHSRLFAITFRQRIDAEKNGSGIGPTPLDCLLYAGHAGVSVDGGSTIYGFNPDGTGLRGWQVMAGLRNPPEIRKKSAR